MTGLAYTAAHPTCMLCDNPVGLWELTCQACRRAAFMAAQPDRWLDEDTPFTDHDTPDEHPGLTKGPTE